MDSLADAADRSLAARSGLAGAGTDSGCWRSHSGSGQIPFHASSWAGCLSLTRAVRLLMLTGRRTAKEEPAADELPWKVKPLCHVAVVAFRRWGQVLGGAGRVKGQGPVVLEVSAQPRALTDFMPR